MSLWDTKCTRKLTSNLVSQSDRDFPLKIDMSLIIEISGKILHLQLILALIPTVYTHLIVNCVIQQKTIAYKMHLSYHFTIVYL